MRPFTRSRSRAARSPTARRPVAEVLEVRSLLSAGAMDLSFGEPILFPQPPVNPFRPDHRGFTVTDFGGFDQGQAVALQPDGKIVVAGSSQFLGRFAVARYNYDGTPDSTFGPSGTGRIELTARPFFDTRAYRSEADAVAVQPDGRIVIVGSTVLSDSSSSLKFHDVAVTRLWPDGQVDLNFGGGGFAVFSVEGGDDFARSVALQTDGKIVITGTAQNLDYHQQNDVFVARLRTDGSLDGSFGTSGKAILNIGDDDRASAVALDPEGKIVVTGMAVAPSRNKFDILVARFTTTGALDTSRTQGFGPLAPRSLQRTGYVLTSLSQSLYPDAGKGVVVQPDGRIVVAGSASLGGSVILRYNTQGTLDPSFSGDGKQFWDGPTTLNGLALQRNGQIVLVGGAPQDTLGTLALKRLNPNGSFDTTFAKTTNPGYQFPLRNNVAGNAVAIQPNGRIVVVASSQAQADPMRTDWIVARYLDGRVLQGNYGDQAEADPAVFRRKTAGWSIGWVVGEAKVHPIATTFGTPDMNASIPVAADYDGDGLTDQAIYLPLVNQWHIHYRTGRSATFTFGSYYSGVPTPADYDGDARADLATYNPATAVWTIWQSSTGHTMTAQIPRLRASPKFIPVPADFNGDGKADLAVFDTGTANWIIKQSGTGRRITRNVAEFTPNLAWIPVPADFNGDGKAELAAFRVSDARWRGYDLTGTTLLFNATFGRRRWLDIPLGASFGSLHRLGKI